MTNVKTYSHHSNKKPPTAHFNTSRKTISSTENVYPIHLNESSFLCGLDVFQPENCALFTNALYISPA
jgi:hypothetical protein